MFGIKHMTQGLGRSYTGFCAGFCTLIPLKQSYIHAESNNVITCAHDGHPQRAQTLTFIKVFQCFTSSYIAKVMHKIKISSNFSSIHIHYHYFFFFFGGGEVMVSPPILVWPCPPPSLTCHLQPCCQRQILFPSCPESC